MVASETEIMNSALTKIGGAIILARTDNSREAKICNVRFDHARRIVLRMHPWNCAMTRVTLAPTTDVVPFDFSYSFQFPSDLLRVYSIDEDVEYRIEGRNLLCDETVVNMRYLKNLTDYGLMDDLLAEAIACYLAWDIAFAVTGKNDARDTCWQQYRQILGSAKTVDAQEERDYGITANGFLDARTGGFSPGRANR